MIIFGTRTAAIIVAVLTLVCGNCHATAAQRIVKRVTKFTLFFIPLFPVSTRQYVECVHCGIQTPVDQMQVDRFLQYIDELRIERELTAELAAPPASTG
ncbi:MAG: zinc-ribbon domain-containing protein [Rhodoglobus sp.]